MLFKSIEMHTGKLKKKKSLLTFENNTALQKTMLTGEMWLYQ